MSKTPKPPRDDDPTEVMAHLGPALPLIAYEAVQTGFFRYAKSREIDPEGFADYTDSCRAGMLNDRISRVTQELIDVASASDPRLGWQLSDNRRATEILCDPYIAIRIKRSKRNRGHLTTSYFTKRQQRIKSRRTGAMFRQMVLNFGPDWFVGPSANRLWLTVPFDLDDVEESVSRVSIGVELRKSFLWKEPLLEGEPEILARLTAPLADRLVELREIRSA